MSVFKSFRKTNVNDELDLAAAEEILKKIFEESGQEANSIPLEILASYSKYRKERFLLQRTIVLIILILFLLLPLMFVAPQFEVASLTPGYSPSPAYQVNVETRMPIDRITAEIHGQLFPVYEEASDIYKIQPTVNGEMTVTTTLINRQTMSHTITVDNVDRESPSMVSNSTQKDTVTLYLSDAGSGIDYANVYAIDTSGQRISPKSYDEDFGEVVFDYPEGTINVFVADRAENTLHLILSVPERSESDAESNSEADTESGSGAE